MVKVNEKFLRKTFRAILLYEISQFQSILEIRRRVMEISIFDIADVLAREIAPIEFPVILAVLKEVYEHNSLAILQEELIKSEYSYGAELASILRNTLWEEEYAF